MNTNHLFNWLIVLIILAGCQSVPETIMESKILSINTNLKVEDPYKEIGVQRSYLSSSKKKGIVELPQDSEVVEINNSKIACALSDELALKELFFRMTEQSQFFLIDPTKDTIIEGNRGTIVRIPANAFVKKSSKIVDDAVKFELVEYLNKSEFIFASLSTHTNKGDLLESGGTILLNAYFGNEVLSLAKGKSIQFEVPTKSLKEDMELFSGARDVHGIMKWNSINTKKGKGVSSTKIRKQRYSKEEAVIEEKILVRYKDGEEIFSKNRINATFSEILKNKKVDTVSVYFEIDENNCIRNSVSKSTIGKGKRRPVFSNTGNWRWGKWFNIKDGSKVNLSKYLIVDPIFSRVSHFYFEGGCLKNKIKRKDRNKTLVFSMQRIFLFTDTLKTIEKEEDKRRLATIESQLSNEGGSYIDAEDMNFYVFTTANLGWINVDRFIQFKGPKVKFVLEDKSLEKSNVSMVFKNYQSVIPGYLEDDKVQFHNIPLDANVIIVALKMVNGLPMIYIKDTKIVRGKFEHQVEFKPVSFAELQEEMKKLNK